MRVGADPILPSLPSSAWSLPLTYLSHLLVYSILHCHFLTTVLAYHLSLINIYYYYFTVHKPKLTT